MDAEVGGCGDVRGLLLGHCPGSVVAVLVTGPGGVQVPQGRRGVVALAVPSSAGWAEPVAGTSVGLQGHACRVALGVAQAGVEGERTQHSGSKPMSGGHLPMASWFTERLGREFHQIGRAHV